MRPQNVPRFSARQRLQIAARGSASLRCGDLYCRTPALLRRTRFRVGSRSRPPNLRISAIFGRHRQHALGDPRQLPLFIVDGHETRPIRKRKMLTLQVPGFWGRDTHCPIFVAERQRPDRQRRRSPVKARPIRKFPRPQPPEKVRSGKKSLAASGASSRLPRRPAERFRAAPLCSTPALRGACLQRYRLGVGS